MLGGREPDCPECFNGPVQRACLEHSSVLSIATDGILSSQEIPNSSHRLGAWYVGARGKAGCVAWNAGYLRVPGYGKPKECDRCRSAGNACPEHASDKKFKRRGLGL